MPAGSRRCVAGTGATCTVRGTTTPTLMSKFTLVTFGPLVITVLRIVVFCSVVSDTLLEAIGRLPCAVLLAAAGRLRDLSCLLPRLCAPCLAPPGCGVSVCCAAACRAGLRCWLRRLASVLALCGRLLVRCLACDFCVAFGSGWCAPARPSRGPGAEFRGRATAAPPDGPDGLACRRAARAGAAAATLAAALRQGERRTRGQRERCHGNQQCLSHCSSPLGSPPPARGMLLNATSRARVPRFHAKMRRNVMFHECAFTSRDRHAIVRRDIRGIGEGAGGETRLRRRHAIEGVPRQRGRDAGARAGARREARRGRARRPAARARAPHRARQAAAARAGHAPDRSRHAVPRIVAARRQRHVRRRDPRRRHHHRASAASKGANA